MVIYTRNTRSGYVLALGCTSKQQLDLEVPLLSQLAARPNTNVLGIKVSTSLVATDGCCTTTRVYECMSILMYEGACVSGCTGMGVLCIRICVYVFEYIDVTPFFFYLPLWEVSFRAYVCVCARSSRPCSL